MTVHRLCIKALFLPLYKHTHFIYNKIYIFIYRSELLCEFVVLKLWNQSTSLHFWFPQAEDVLHVLLYDIKYIPQFNHKALTYQC